MAAPKLNGASVVLYDDARILLIKRGKEPYLGSWSLPGGGQEPGETLEACAKRELEEETGLVGTGLTEVLTHERITSNNNCVITHHYILTTFRADSFSGELVVGDDAADARWFTRQQIAQLTTTPELLDLLEEVIGPDLL